MALTYVTTLELIHCGECGVPFGLSDEFMAERKRDHKTWYCPNGHARHYPGITDAEKIRRLEAERTHLRDQRDAAERSRAAQKAQATKLRGKLKRVENGVCPECNRSFQDLARHMASKHKDHE